MSLQYSDTTNENGIIQLIEDELGFDRGFITDNATRHKQFNSLVNLAYDDYTEIAIKASGTAQWDDSNHSSHHPIVYMDLVSGQDDYTPITDEDGALILEFYKVGVLSSASATVYDEIEKVDQQTKNRGTDIFDESTSNSAPYQYDQTGSTIFLNPAPNYNATKGLKMLINREAMHFTTSDTSKKPGVPGTHHEYFVLKPCYVWARRHNLKNVARLEKDVVKYEGSDDEGITGKIARMFARREKDKRHVMTASPRTSLKNYPPM